MIKGDDSKSSTKIFAVSPKVLETAFKDFKYKFISDDLETQAKIHIVQYDIDNSI